MSSVKDVRKDKLSYPFLFQPDNRQPGGLYVRLSADAVGKLYHSPTQPQTAPIQEAGDPFLVHHQTRTSCTTWVILLWRAKQEVNCFLNTDVDVESVKERERTSLTAGIAHWGSGLERGVSSSR